MKQFVLLSVAAIYAAGAASAAPMCATATLDTFLVGGFECEIDSAVFSNFSFQQQGGGTVDHLDADEITVDPLSGLNEVGLRFSGDFGVEGGADVPNSPAGGLRSTVYRFIYDVTRANSEFFEATSVIDPEYIYTWVNPNKFGGILLGKSIANDGAGASAVVNRFDVDLMESVLLNTPREMIAVDDLFQITGGASAEGTQTPVGFAFAGFVENRFRYTEDEAVPEPATWTMMLGAGALLFGILRQRRR